MQNENIIKNFLVISSDLDRQVLLSELVQKYYLNSNILNAIDSRIGLSKIRNSQIDIILTDSEFSKVNVHKTIETIFLDNINPRSSVICIGHPPEEESFLEEIITGRLYFIEDKIDEFDLNFALERAINYTPSKDSNTYHLCLLPKGEVLINEGDVAEYVYILKHGELQAYQQINNQKVVIGKIEIGEFVGEMSYINKEPRSASIEALVDSELIEIPIGQFEKILFKRPAWSKALMNTLAKRLKSANKRISKT